MLIAAWHVGRLLALSRATLGGFLVGTGCINTSYFAYPVVLATLGESGLAYAVLFDVGQTTLTLTVIYALALSHGTAGIGGRSAVQRFLASPPLWALTTVLTLKCFGLRLPMWALDVLVPVHLTTTPLASLVLGLSISLTALGNIRLAAAGVALRMLGGLLLGVGAAELLQLAGVERAVVVLVAGMPSAVTAVIFAAEARLDEELTAAIVALSVSVGVALLPWLPRFAAWLAV
jgi:predicted permease